jgi:hypothetical protein
MEQWHQESIVELRPCRTWDLEVALKPQIAQLSRSSNVNLKTALEDSTSHESISRPKINTTKKKRTSNNCHINP